MERFEQLVKALRCKRDDCEGCDLSFFDKDEGWMCQYAAKDDDAADAIEALEKQIDSIENDKTNLEADIINLEIAIDKVNTQLPKRGKWVEDTTTYAGPGLSNYKCSLCGKICGTWKRGLKPNELPNWCGNCGAKMNDSNVSNALDNAQDGPIITPCRGCSDYDGYGGCKSKGGCARAKMEVQE